MKRRRWDSKTKTMIVLEGLSGRQVSEICNEYGMHQNQYCSRRDKCSSEAHRAFESKKDGAEVNKVSLKIPPVILRYCQVSLALTGPVLRGKVKKLDRFKFILFDNFSRYKCGLVSLLSCIKFSLESDRKYV